MRLVNLLPSVNLEGEVLDSHPVVAMRAAIRPADSEHRGVRAGSSCPCLRVLEIHDLLGSSVARIPDTLFPAEWAEEVEIEGEGSLDVGDGQVDVMDSSRGQRPAQSIRTGGPAKPGRAAHQEARSSPLRLAGFQFAATVVQFSNREDDHGEMMADCRRFESDSKRQLSITGPKDDVVAAAVQHAAAAPGHPDKSELREPLRGMLEPKIAYCLARVRPNRSRPSPTRPERSRKDRPRRRLPLWRSIAARPPQARPILG